MALLAAKYGEGAILCITPEDAVEVVEIVCKREVGVPSPETIGLEDLFLSKGIVHCRSSFLRRYLRLTFIFNCCLWEYS